MVAEKKSCHAGFGSMPKPNFRQARHASACQFERNGTEENLGDEVTPKSTGEILKNCAGISKSRVIYYIIQLLLLFKWIYMDPHTRKEKRKI